MTTNLGALPDYNRTKDAKAEKAKEKAKPKVMHYDKNPEEHANIFSYLFFSFVTPLVTHGFRTPLTPEDLWPIAHQDKCEVTGARLDKIWQADRAKKGAKASLFNCTFRYFGLSMLWIGLLTAVARAGELAQPTILGEFILWYVDPFAPMWQGYVWAVTFFLIPFISAIVTAQSMQIATRGMAQLRGALASMVYDKSIRISSTSNVALPERQSKKSKKAEKKEKGKKGEKDEATVLLGKPKPQQETTTGKVVNLMSADAEKVGMMMMMAPNSLITPIQVAVNLALIYQTMEAATFAGLGALFLAAPFMGMALRWMTVYTQKQNLLTDSRMKIINELMQGMRMVKFYAWETSFYDKVNLVRKAELREIFRVTFSFQFFNLVLMLVPVVIPLATFSVYLYAYGNVNVFKIFKTLAYFQTLQMPLVMIPMSLSQLGVGAVSCKRIQTFLELPELDPALVKQTPADATYSLIAQGTFAYEPNQAPPGAQKKHEPNPEETVIEITKPFQLTDLNFRAQTGKLTAVIGSVGSGKSTLVSALLGEMRPVPGTQALVQCAEHVGYAAQKAWIQSVTIRDNILFGREYNEARYTATVHACALTADFTSLPHGDSTEIGDRGINLSGGQKQRIALARCVYSGATSFVFDDPLSAVDANVGEHIMKQCFVQALEGTTRVLVMNQLHFLPLCDFVYVLDKGNVVAMGTFDELNAGNPYFQKLVQEHNAALNADSQEQKLMSPAEMARAPSEEKNAAKKLTAEDIAGLRTPARLLTLEEQMDDRLPDSDQTTAEEIGTGRVAGSGYVTHAKFMSWPLFFGYLICSCAAQAGLTIGNGFVMSWWSSNKFQRDNWFYIELLGLVGLGTGVLVFSRGLFFSFATKRANGRYHDSLFKATLRAPSTFYDVTPTGRILNRFSKDMNDIDGVLPRVWQGAFNMALSILGSLISTAIMTPLFLIIMAIVGILFIALQRFFSRSTIQLKRIEAVSRSPVYSHFGETLAGLATIRAFKHAERFRFTKILRVDRMTHSFFTLRCVLNWASLRVGTLNAIMLAFAALFVVLSKGVLDPGSASLAVYFVLGIGPMLGFLVSSITELDNNMNAVERVHQYSLGMAQEASWDKSEVAVPENWPAEGKISLKDVVFRYRKNLDPVLHGISAEINSKEKIGVAGRTGSGKSSLMLCLFRMYEYDSGTIHIDGIDIQKLGLHVLRKKLAIIPQDPFVFSGTIRENLDPFHAATDEEVWDSLAKVQLDGPTKAMGGLLAPVKEYGENLSAGQRQLLCIARAVLRKPKILVMDEATSSVDSSTDTMIQNMVRTAFKDSTTVTIAHRLNTIMDCDRVMVLKSGNLAEFGEPAALVASGGVFAAMHHAMTHGH